MSHVHGPGTRVRLRLDRGESVCESLTEYYQCAGFISTLEAPPLL